MKKSLLIAASALIVFASCTKVSIRHEDKNPQEIALFSVNKNMTKGAINNGGAFPDTYPMQVSAYLASGTGATAGEYFANKTFSNSLGNVWTGGQYWPLSDSQINFFAVAPEIGNNTNGVKTTFNEIKESKKKATTTVTGNNINQYDVMYALGQGSHTATEAYENVNMKFMHALSWINFTVSKGATTPEITVNRITVNDVAFDGTATFSVDEANYTSVTKTDVDSKEVEILSWTSTTIENKTLDPADITLLTTETPIPNGMLVIPGTYTNPSFTINYSVTQDGKTFTYDYTHSLETTTWAAGTKYCYDIVITLQQIKITPSVDNWDSSPDKTINIEK